MEKILLISDSHGCAQRLHYIVQQESPEEIYFLGDGIGDLRGLNVPYQAVRGNCDMASGDKIVYVSWKETEILLTHGDLFQVKFGLDQLVTYAQEKKVHMVCYGHTHTAQDEVIRGIRCINPGSLYEGSYAVMFQKEGVVIVEFKTV